MKTIKRATTISIGLMMVLSLLVPAPALSEEFDDKVQQAKTLFEEKKYEDSIAKSTELLQEQPQNADLLLNRGISYYSAGKSKEALEDLLKAIAINPELNIVNYNLGLVYNTLEKYDQSIIVLTTYLKAAEDAAALRTRGLAYRMKEKYQEAVDDCTAAIKLEPGDSDNYLERAYAYQSLNEHKKAVEDFNTAGGLDAKNPDIYYYRGVSYYYLGQFEDALDNYSRVLKYKPNDVDTLHNRACVYFEQMGQHKAALDDINEALKKAPDNFECHCVRGNICYEMGNMAEAEKEYLKALGLDPKNLDVLISLATTHCEMGKFKQAEEELLKVLAANPKSEFAKTNLSIVYLVLDKPEKAFQGAASDRSEEKELSTLGARAWAHSAQGNKTAMAEDLVALDRMIALCKPEQQRDALFANSYAALAEVFSGQPERALLRIDQLIKDAPMGNKSLQGWCHGIRALILAQLGQKDEAANEVALSDVADKNSQTANWLRLKAKQVIAGGGSQFPSSSSSTASATSGGAPAGSEGLNRPVDDKWALIIGVGKFQDPTIPKLRYATKDAQDFAKYLVEKANFKKDHVRVLLDEQATRVRIYEEIGDKFLPRVAGKNDLVLFYFSGHGSGASHDVKGENYLITHDANKNSLFASGIELQELTKVMKRRIDSDRVLIVLDACHSGGADASSKDIEPGSNFDANMIAGSGQLVICSSEQDQRSYESQRYANGVFTRKLMDALSKNGQITKLKDAFNFLVDEVSREVKEDAAKAQTPVMKSQWNGNDISVGIVPFKPRAFPPTVREKLAPDSFSGTATPAARSQPSSTPRAKH